MYKSCRGRIISTIRSRYAKISTIMSSSVAGAGYGDTGSVPLVILTTCAPHSEIATTYLVFRVTTGVNDTIHIQVQIVKLFTVGIGLGGVHRNHLAVDIFGFFFDYSRDHSWEFIGQPSDRGFVKKAYRQNT